MALVPVCLPFSNGPCSLMREQTNMGPSNIMAGHICTYKKMSLICRMAFSICYTLNNTCTKSTCTCRFHFYQGRFSVHCRTCTCMSCSRSPFQLVTVNMSITVFTVKQFSEVQGLSKSRWACKNNY